MFFLLVVFLLSVLQRPNQRLKESVVALRSEIAERRRLETEILEVSEREQQRIGEDIHDSLCQHRAGTAVSASMLQSSLTKKSPADGSAVGQIARLIHDAVEHAHRLARGLSPVTLDSEGLQAALAELAFSVEKLFGVTCSFDCTQPVAVPDHTRALHLYRIAQEAVSNAIKHGKAKGVALRLASRNGSVTLTVEDDGVGMAEPASGIQGMGLNTMKHRAYLLGGTLVFAKADNGGTRVVCSCPLMEEAQDVGQASN
jgi:signal transduction histidine kinase